MSGPYVTARERLDAIKIVLAITGGIGGVVFLTIAYRKQRLGESADDREHSKLFHERFEAGSAQLYSEKAGVRMAGVYTIAALADDWVEGRQRCINVLCGYMRMPYMPAALLDNDTPRDRIEAAMEEYHVRSTLLNVVGEQLRKAPRKGQTWHGLDFDFHGAVIDVGDLSGAKFTGGRINFDGAKFVEGIVNFRDTEFRSGHISFDNCIFQLQTLDFTGAKITGAHVSFMASRFVSGQAHFVHMKLTDGFLMFFAAHVLDAAVVFTNTDFAGCATSFSGVTFAEGEVGFADTTFSGTQCNFNHAQFIGGRIRFDRAKITAGNINMREASFKGANMTFSGIELAGGTLDLRSPTEYSKPPVFDDYPNGRPAGLRFPC